MSGAKQASKRKCRIEIAPALGAAGLLSLAGGVSAATGPQAADALTRNTIVSQEIMLGEEKEHGVRLACGC